MEFIVLFLNGNSSRGLRFMDLNEERKLIIDSKISFVDLQVSRTVSKL